MSWQKWAAAVVWICGTSGWGIGGWNAEGRAAEDWPQFRGPRSLGVSTAQQLPVTWNDEENLAWKSKLPGHGASSPICVGDKIIVTCYSGYGLNQDDPGNMDDLRLHVVCFQAGDGKQLWQTDVQPKLPETDRVRDHGYAAATPASDGRAIYVFFGKTGVLKFDMEGKQLWQTSVGDKTHGWGCGTSPVLFENLVIVNASVESGSLVALNQESGQEVWRAPGMEESWNTPHLVDLPSGKKELVVSVANKVLAFDPSTGEQLWSCDGVPDYVCPSVISADGIVYVLGGRQSRSMAIRAGGRGDVTQSHKIWEQKAGANVTSPVLHDGHLYWVSDRNQVAYCVRAADGEVVYSERFPAQPYASALLADGKLYIVTRGEGTYVLAAQPKYEQLAHNEFSDRSTFNASPIVAQGRLIIRSDEWLYAVGSR